MANSARQIFYDKRGCKISAEQWERLIQDPEYCQLGFDDFGDFYIGTIWSGIDCGDFDDPIIFNTYIGNSQNGLVLYYSKEKMAIKHHNMFTFMADQECLDKFIEERFL